MMVSTDDRPPYCRQLVLCVSDVDVSETKACYKNVEVAMPDGKQNTDQVIWQ